MRDKGVRTDMDLAVLAADRRDFAELSKFELLFKLLYDGARPMSQLEGLAAIVWPDSEPVVSLAMMVRSKKYLEALVLREALWGLGLRCFHHGGAHFYYMCLLHLDDFTALNAIKDVGKTTNEQWKDLLRARGDAAALALADAEEAEPAEDSDGVLAHVGLVAKTVPPPKKIAKTKDAKVLDAMTFKFKVETAEGPASLSIGIDGFSHTSRRRRAYAKCV